jgi:uncharacterized protein YgiM (DUF1202 family)
MVKLPRAMKFTAMGALTVALMFSLVLLLAGIIFSGVALPLWAQSQTFPTSGVVTTEDDRLNLRDAPTTDSEIIGKIEPQSQVQVLAVSDDGAWYQVKAAGIGTGWVSSEWVSLGDAPAHTTNVVLLPTLTPTPKTAAGAVNLGVAALIAVPATSAPAVPTAEKSITTPTTKAAATVKATAEAPMEATATAEATIAPTPVPTLAATPSVPTAITQPQRMNVRGGPGTAFPIVSSVDQGTALEITGITPVGDWYRVKLNEGGDAGWVFGSLVTVVGPDGTIATLSQEELPALPTPDPAAAVQSVAAAPPVVGAPPPAGGGFFGYGVQAHMLGGEIGRAMDAVNDLGFGWIKQQISWKLFGGDGGGGSTGDIGAIVNEAGARGINVLLSVVDAPSWAREPGFDSSVGGPPADPSSYAAYVGGIAGSYCGTALKAIEVWNEENLHYEWGNKPLDPAEYLRLLQAAYTSIMAACPSMLVISGALTPAGSNPPFAMDDFAYLEGMYQNGLANYSDGIGAHPSGYNVPADVRFEDACAAIQQSGNSFNGACDTPHHSWSFRSTMEGYRNIMNVYGDSNKRIWPTEFGWAAGGAFDGRYAYANDNSFDEQAAWTVQAYTMMREWGWVGPAFLWNLNFRVVADGTEKAQWGIVGNDWSPLPVYTALKNMPK